jgi:mannose-1-phosphate guanylyltransferase
MAITKAFMLGAGLGTRLRPLTDVLPKPLVPVWNEPLIFHALRHCQNAGILDFAINTHHLPQCWNQVFPTSTFEGSSISLFYEEELLETGGGIKNIASFIGDDSVLVFNGDIFSDIDLKGLIHAHLKSGDVATLAIKSFGPSCNVAVQDGRVVDIRNALSINPGNSQFTGIYCIRPEILRLIPQAKKNSIIPAFLELIKLGQIGSFNVDAARWIDIGTIETYRDIHQNSEHKNQCGSFLSNSAIIEENCSISNSIIWPNTHVMAGSSLENCIVYSPTPISGHFKDVLL